MFMENFFILICRINIDLSVGWRSRSQGSFLEAMAFQIGFKDRLDLGAIKLQSQSKKPIKAGPSDLSEFYTLFSSEVHFPNLI